MNRFSLADKTLRLLAAQVNLNGSFRHLCSFKNTNHPLIFVLEVERAPAETLFTVIIGDEKHSLTVCDSDHDTHLVLADFIESIANGRIDTAEPATPRNSAESVNCGQLLDSNQQEQLQQLVRKGGSLKLDIGLDEVVNLAVHRTPGRQGITAILATGDSSPRTQCFTTSGDDQRSYKQLLQSLEHLATSAVSAALAA